MKHAKILFFNHNIFGRVFGRVSFWYLKEQSEYRFPQALAGSEPYWSTYIGLAFPIDTVVDNF